MTKKSNETETDSQIHVSEVRSANQLGDFDPFLRRPYPPAISMKTAETTFRAIYQLRDEQMINERFLAQEFIPSLGLNDELLSEQPIEFSSQYGKGIFLWQYPNQLSKLLAFLAREHPDIKHYFEIGSRWGGTFFLITNWLHRICGSSFKKATALDLIDEPDLVSHLKRLTAGNLEIEYLRQDSHDLSTKNWVRTHKPDMVFIDGEHSIQAALHDHLLIQASANVIVHHDVSSDSLPHLHFLFEALRYLTRLEFESWRFDDQYDSVNGNYLGIGLMVRRKQ